MAAQDRLPLRNLYFCSRMKKIWVIGALVAVLIVITIAYIRLVLALSENRPAYDALPASTSIVFELKNPADALDKFNSSAFHLSLTRAGFFKKLLAQINTIDSFVLLGNTDTTFSTWADATLLASMNINGRDEFDYLYVLKKEHFNKSQFEQFIGTIEDSLKLNKRVFKEATIYEWTNNAGNNFSCAFVNGLLLGSFTPVLLDEAVAHLREGESLLKNKGFREVNDVAGEDADIVAYINFANLGRYESMLVNETQSALFQSLKHFSDWMELDFKVKDNSFLINGYTASGDSTFLADFNREPTSQVEITHLLPFNTALFFYHAVDDFRSYIDKRGVTFTGELENFQNWIGNEWCFGLLEPLDENYEDDAFLVVKALDSQIAAQSLAERARLFGDDLKAMEEFKTYPIGQLSLNDELNNLFDHQFLKINFPYYAVLDEYVVFASDLSVIKIVLDNYEERLTLASDPDYMVFERNLTTTSNIFFYFNTARSLELLNRLLSNSLVADIRKGDKDFVKFSPVALQFSQYQDIFFTNGYVQFSANMEQHSNRLWQVKLEGQPSGTPVFVTNHYTGEKEILMQDSLHILYLITKAGRILWKHQLDSPVMSEIYLIDFYENTKLQYAFNTKGKIYLIDRKGENVSNYPIKLPAAATNGMLLVDYEKKKDYRMFVACANGKIYGYYKSGKPLPGWSPQEKVGIVKFPMRYVFSQGKDYLIATNEAGDIHFFNRKGDRRNKPVKLEKNFTNDFRMRLTESGFQLFNVDKEGTVYKVHHNGASSSQKQPALPQSFFDFQYTDLNGDGSYEMIFIDSLAAKVFNEKLEEIATPTFNQKIDKAFLLNTSGQKGIGYLSSASGNIYYTDENYQPNAAFPLNGCTPFIAADLFETGRKVIIAGDCEGWVNAYQVK